MSEQHVQSGLGPFSMVKINCDGAQTCRISTMPLVLLVLGVTPAAASFDVVTTVSDSDTEMVLVDQ